MKRVRFVHWNPGEARKKAAEIRRTGYAVNSRVLRNYRDFRSLRNNPPDAVVIDLSRLPSRGRDVGLALRSSRSTRGIPLIFVDGKPEKVAGVRKLLPDAIYTEWRRIQRSLRDALAHPPLTPLIPASSLEGYSGAPLVKKLGIKPDAVVALINAPEGFERTLGRLPPGVVLQRSRRGKRDLSIWFTTSQGELRSGFPRVAAMVEDGGLWILWPKRASGMGSDLTQAVVRQVGLAAGFVDFKICSVDASWSGLRFVRRRPTSF